MDIDIFRIVLVWEKLSQAQNTMGQTYSDIYFHIVFSTKQRIPMINSSFEDRLYAIFFSIAKREGCELIAVGGTADHIHIAIRAKPIVSISKVVNKLKSNTSKWINLEHKPQQKFQWQSGYGVFSVSQSIVPKVKSYIQNQKRRHQSKSFDDEYIQLLKHHKIAYDERYVFND